MNKMALQNTSIQLSCRLEPQQITVGDKVQVDCEGPIQRQNGDLPVEVSIHAPQENTWGMLTEPEISDGHFKIMVTAYRPGQHRLSDISLKIDGHDFVLGGDKLEVTSIIKPDPQGKMPTPYDIVNPGSISYPLWWWIMWGVIAAAVLGWGTRAYFKFRKAQAERKASGGPERPLTPREKFDIAIRKLESSGRHQRGEYKSFALELTAIMKRALQAELGLNAEEMTTEELIEQLEKRYKKFFSGSGMDLKVLFTQLDQIKFAKVVVHADDCQKLLDLVSRIGHGLFPELKTASSFQGGRQ